ncbi:MAG: hypothetical protein WDO14_21860 [Bacteroidota bacterium]
MSDGQIMTTADLRKTTNVKMLKKYKATADKPSGFITEQYKWNWLKMHPQFKKYAFAYIGYKFFSQIDHYSPKSLDFLAVENEGHSFYYVFMSVETIFIFTNTLIQFVGGKDNIHVTHLDQAQKGLDQLFNIQ